MMGGVERLRYFWLWCLMTPGEWWWLTCGKEVHPGSEADVEAED
jgi:hypothetical protein